MRLRNLRSFAALRGCEEIATYVGAGSQPARREAHRTGPAESRPLHTQMTGTNPHQHWEFLRSRQVKGTASALPPLQAQPRYFKLPYVVNPTLYGTVAYDPIKYFDPVTLAVTTTCVLTVHASVPAHTVKDLVDFIKASPGKLSYASPGTGTSPHLVGELFRLSLGLDLAHVPFNSGGLAAASAIAGHTPISFGVPAPAVMHIREGRLRALAVTSRTRSQALPDVPTMAEAGYPDIEGDAWYAVVVPAGTPKEIIALLHREIVKIVMLPELQERLVALGFERVANTPDEFAAQIKTEIAKWASVIRAAGIKTE